MPTEPRLDHLTIATPCTADWNAMAGDDKRRFCAECKLNVHNVSAMTKDEAMEVLSAAGQGRVCVRFFRRVDGTVLTQDCPVGVRRRLRQAWARSAALVAALFTCTLSLFGCTPDEKVPADHATTTPTPHPEPKVLQGEVAVPEPCHMGMVAEPTMGRVQASPPPQAPTPR